MDKYIYLNNFPSQGAVKGQEFKGDSDLEAKLLERGVIGTGKPTVSTVDAKEVESLKASVEEKDAEIESLKASAEEKDAKEVESLKASVEEKDAEIESLKASVEEKDTEIESLKAMLKESINLPKGQKPEGYKG